MNRSKAFAEAISIWLETPEETRIWLKKMADTPISPELKERLYGPGGYLYKEPEKKAIALVNK